MFLSFLLALDRLLFHRRPRAAVLMYHHLRKEKDAFSIPIDTLKKQITTLRSLGYRFVFADDIPSWTPADGNVCALTFDDGYLDNLELRTLDVPVTIFVTTKPEMTEMDARTEDIDPEKLITTLQKHPHIRFAAHGVTHRKWTRLSPEALERELAESKQTLEKLSGRAVRSCAYPKGSVNDPVKSSVRKHFSCAFLADGGVLTRPIEDPFRIARIGIFSHTSEQEFRLRLSPLFPYLIAIRRLWRR